MACPTIEEVTREFIRRMQVYFATAVNVFGASGVTSIEVVDAQGAPVLDTNDRPQVAVTSVSVQRSLRFGADVGRVLVSIDQVAATGIDAPSPLLRDVEFTLTCTAMRESTDTTGRPGILWLQEQLMLFAMTGGADGPLLCGVGWTGDEADGEFVGYLMELSSEPRPLAVHTADLRGFSASVVVRNIRLTDGTQGQVQAASSAELTFGVLDSG